MFSVVSVRLFTKGVLYDHCPRCIVPDHSVTPSSCPDATDMGPHCTGTTSLALVPSTPDKGLHSQNTFKLVHIMQLASGRSASNWNAFLLILNWVCTSVNLFMCSRTRKTKTKTENQFIGRAWDVELSWLKLIMKIKHCKYERGTQLILIYLPSVTKLRQGNIFTGVCQSFCSQGEGSASVHAGKHPPGQTPPPLGRHHPHPPPPEAESTTHPEAGSTPPPRRNRKHTPEGHCSERYASYWNAFLFSHDLTEAYFNKNWKWMWNYFVLHWAVSL